MVRIILWKEGCGQSQNMYLCGKNGVTYDNISINTKNHPITVYLMSSLFDEMSKNNLLAFGDANPHYALLTASAKKETKNYINQRYHSDAVAEVKNIKETDLYPYKGEAKDKLDDAERQYFDLIAVEINSVMPTFRNAPNDTKKLTYRLIREAVKTSPDNLTKILTEVFRLSSEQQEELAKLLDYTTLPAIINMTQTISDRLLFIHALEQMIYNKDVGAPIKERTQFHKILLEELWVFGEKYALGASDISLQNVLKKYLMHLGREELIPVIPQEAANDATLIPDLCLWKQYPIHGERIENLVIELKRPTKILGHHELDQIKKYAYAIADDPLFPKENTKWSFLLLGMDFDSYVERELEDQKVGDGNYYNSSVRPYIYFGMALEQNYSGKQIAFQFLKEQIRIYNK